jgi:trans-2,3-dihydro-3-hydroxyanthranilate isomerase
MFNEHDRDNLHTTESNLGTRSTILKKTDNVKELSGQIRFKQVDVFTTERLAGNPLAVFFDADGLDSIMQKIALEMNLSETTFVQTPFSEKADYRNRIFTRTSEIPFAGHPSIGTAFALVEEGVIKLTGNLTTVYQEVGIGVLPIDIYSNGEKIEKIMMTQGTPRFGNVIKDIDIDRLARAKGIDPEEIRGTNLSPQVVSTGLNFCIVPVLSLDAISNPEQPNMDDLNYLREKYDFRSASMFTLETSSEEAFVHARVYSIPELREDPGTGSNAGCLGAYLMKWGILSKESNPSTFIIEQGIEVKKPCKIHVEVYHRKGEPDKIRVGGQAVTVINGTLIY